MLDVKDISRALLSLRPGTVWTLVGNDYKNIVWESEDSKPTIKQLEAEIARLENEDADRLALEQANKESAYAKLTALGLSTEEISALLGGN